MRVAVLILLVSLPAAAQSVDACRNMRQHGQLDEAKSCYARLLSSDDPYLRAEGFWGTGRYRDANEQFKLAIAARPKDPMYRVRWGRLFAERFNEPEAMKLFQEALEIQKKYAPALLGLAVVASHGFEQKAVELAEEAAQLDPKMAEARELLARLALEDGNMDRAIEQADKALAISGEALNAMAVRATIDWLKVRNPTPQSPSAWLDRSLKVNPRFGEAFALAARIFVLNRRYREGIAFYRKALELNSELWEARSELGVNQMRLGEDEEARRNLELCYKNGYDSSATVNSLTLLDSYKNFAVFKTPTTIVKLHKKEADLLRPYMEHELQRAMRTYEKKYKIKLQSPVQLEVYPDHEDFAVRTMGMPGLGALGVTFGSVVAMDSPSGRKPGSFHWASTLWHELSHVYVLAATNHRVPRWFTEGMAVHEETAASPEWGDPITPEIIAALRKKKLLPVAELDRGFIRPAYPTQVVVSYYQAGKICDYINERWGYQKLLDIMHAFGDLKSTPQVIEEQLGMKPEAFDKELLAWIDAQTGKTVAGFDDWRKGLKMVAATAKLKAYDQVIEQAKSIRDSYPEYVEAGSVYEFLADAYLDKGDKKSATAELERYARAGGRDPELLKKLAALQEEAGNRKEAALALQRVNYIYPVQNEELHRKLGDLDMELGQVDDALVEYQAVLASKPVDPAGAHFRLAQALYKVKRMDKAQEHLLSALEVAPGYRPAQKMLLELSRQSTTGADRKE